MLEMAELLRQGRVADPFFEVIHDGQWNACVGVQGDELNYVEGYLQAAQLLVDTLIEKRLLGHRDTLAMPILYTTRHGLELALKFVLRELTAIGMTKAREGAADHDLLSYWSHLRDQQVGDRVCREQLAALRPFVESLARIDDDGQELRYAENLDGKQSLAGHAVVHLLLIQASITELRAILEQLTDRVIRLGQENPTGSKTKECSRSDLAEIAAQVGARSTWSEESFLDRKAAARERFGLSSNAFSRALNAILGSRDLATIVGVETPLSYLSREKLIDIVERWLDANPPPAVDAEPRIISAASIRFSDIETHMREMSALIQEAEARLSLEEFADLQTVFYIGRDRRYGEEYPRMLEQTVAEHRLAARRLDLIDHILSKANLVDALVAGLRRAGQPSIAEQVDELRERLRPPAGSSGARS
jgi:hypothetical protein